MYAQSASSGGSVFGCLIRGGGRAPISIAWISDRSPKRESRRRTSSAGGVGRAVCNAGMLGADRVTLPLVPGRDQQEWGKNFG
jgi:hypothetical protein